MKNNLLAALIGLVMTVSASKAISDDIRDMVAPCPEDKKDKPVIITSEAINSIKWGTQENNVIAMLGKPNGYLQWGENSGFIYGSNLLLRFKNKKLCGVMLGEQVLDHKIANEMEQFDLWNTWNWSVKDVMSSGSTVDSLIEVQKSNWNGVEYQKVYSDSNFTITPQIVSYSGSHKELVRGILLIRKDSKSNKAK